MITGRILDLTYLTYMYAWYLPSGNLLGRLEYNIELVQSRNRLLPPQKDPCDHHNLER